MNAWLLHPVVPAFRWAYTLAAALTFSSLPAIGRVEAAQEKPAPSVRDRLLKAVAPFTDEDRKAVGLAPLRYGLGKGTVDKTGSVVTPGEPGKPSAQLDCSCFASAVLYRTAHPSFADFNQKIQQGWGDEIAKAYALKSQYQKSVAELFDDIKAGALHEGTYFFDLRDEAGIKKDPAGHGHVGLLLIDGTGNGQVVKQVHMSSSKEATGLDRDGLANNCRFTEFLTATIYGSAAGKKKSQITLYAF